MEQQIQKGEVSQMKTKSETQQPQSNEVLPVKEKRSKWLIRLIIALVIIGIGVGIYLLFFK